MKNNRIFCLSVLLLPLICSCNESEDISPKFLCDMLSKDYAILLAKESSETENYVAKELKDTYFRCTNVNLDILDDIAMLNGKNFISLGNTEQFNGIQARKKIDLSKQALNEDGFYIYTESNNIYINAYNDRGIMYGVYEFLENTLGVKYLSHDYTYYPLSLKEVNLYSYDKAYVPLFPQRAYLNTPVFDNDFNYVAHMRFNTDYAVMPSYMGGSSLWHQFPIPGHTVGSILPYTNYLEGGVDSNGMPLIKEEYKEVYQHRYIDDKVVNNWYLGELDLCYTNGVDYNISNSNSTLNLMIESLKEILTKDTTCEYLHIGQADVAFSCPCSHCSESASKYKSSGVMIRFVNKVEEAVNSYLRETQNGREVTFSMFAYSYNVQPPVNDEGKPIDETVIPNKRVTIKYAPIQADYVYSLDDSRQNDSTRNQLKKWSVLGCDFMAWTYATIFSNYYYYYPHYQSLRNLLTELHNANVIYEFDQSLYNEYNVYQQYLDAYVFSKLCWDIDKDVNELVKEFCKYYFGDDAYMDVYNFHMLMDGHYNYLTTKGITLDSGGSFITGTNFPYQLMNKACQYFADAIAKTNASSSKQKETYIKHLEIASLTPLYMSLRFYPYYDGVNDEMSSSLASKFFDLTDKYGVKKYGENSLLTIANLKKEYGI
ncbi:MAG TPA: hypothetical protein DD377_00375 [Firmicutes bacterium]|nr:hypothetical protein [Bacillota bacterium]